MSETSNAVPTPPPRAVTQAPAPDVSKVVTVFVMVAAILYFGKEVLVPVTLASLLAFVLAPLVTLLRYLHLGKVLSVLLGVIVALAVILAVGGVIGTQIAQLSTDVPKYAATVENKVVNVRDYMAGRLSRLAGSVGMQKALPAPAIVAPPTPGTAPGPLSTPLTLCLVVMGRHVKRLEFLDVMLGDRPALTPVESFYQRILAGDADEAQDHAETLLKERSLSTYYDEVALNGLQLAANVSQRGVLDQAQLDRIKTTIKALIEGLAGYDDKQPSPSEGDKGAIAPPDDEKALPANSDRRPLNPRKSYLPHGDTREQ